MNSYIYSLNGLELKTGDLICTTNGNEEILIGHFWRFIGLLIPGPVDHIIIYTGPGGRCVESGPKGVISFTIPNNKWESELWINQRGPLLDQLYGVVYPLKESNLEQETETKIRIGVADYCLTQAAERKPYNFNFLDSQSENAFYCSQLAYLAYLKLGIDLNTGLGIPQIHGTEKIIFPQEIWSGFPHQKP